ncbi:hypothetical protein [Desulfovibrio porci]|uniref:hypothetical protein n=1 Tax=Desulfovibrio porci TaxID=2605782 RepID=UPI0012B197D1|nr:hypothetical protein [Desulfovibrio porci]
MSRRAAGAGFGNAVLPPGTALHVVGCVRLSIFRSRVTLRRHALQCFIQLKNPFGQTRAVLRREGISTQKRAGVRPRDSFFLAVSPRMAVSTGLSATLAKVVGHNGNSIKQSLCQIEHVVDAVQWRQVICPGYFVVQRVLF